MPPQTTTADWVYSGHPGWLEVDLFDDGQHLGLGAAGQRLPIKLHRKLRGDAKRLTTHGARHVFAYVTRIGHTLVCERIVHEPPRPFEMPGWYSLGALQFAGLLLLCCAWWIGAGNELLRVLPSVVG